MADREARMAQRNLKKEAASKQSLGAEEKGDLKETPQQMEDRERAELRQPVETPEERRIREERIMQTIKDKQSKRIMENKRKPQKHFAYNAEETDYNVDFGRKIIVLPLPPRCVWFDNTKIAFFESTGTSNMGFDFLQGTYFPTLGIRKKTDRFPFMDKLDGSGHVIIKTSLFKELFTGQSKHLTNTPIWLYDLITEYCEERYPTLFDIDFGEFRVDGTNLKMAEELKRQLLEIEHLYRTLKTYFTADWQVSQSIGISRFMGQGIWIGELKDFAAFMDTKITFTLSGFRGPEVEEDGDVSVAIKFLQDNDAQSELQFTEEDKLETSLTTPLEYYVFCSTSFNRLEQDIRSYHNANRFSKRSGGRSKTKRRSVKTRRQKRR